MPRIEDGAVEFTSTVDIDGALNVDGASTLVGDVVASGNFGVASPQGKFHLHDGNGGMLFVTKNAVAGTDVVLIPNAAGDVVQQMYITGTVMGSAGVNFAIQDWITVGATRTFTVAGDSFRIRVNANGSVDCARTAGTQTYGCVFLAIWR